MDPRSSAPARIRVAAGNDGEDPLRAVFGSIPPFTELYSEPTAGGERLVLVPTDRERLRRVVPEVPDGRTWRATDDVGWNATAVVREIPPGDRIARTYDLLAAHGNGSEDRALPPGDYRFEAGDYLGDGPWGFTVSVSY